MASLASTPPVRRADADWPVPWQPGWGPDDGLAARAQAALARAALATLGRLPAPLLRPALGALARLARRLDRRHSDAARAFLRQALGELPPERLEAHVLQAYRHFLRVVVDAERWQRVVPWERTPEHFEVRWSEDARRVVEARGGCVFVTAHLGNWEILVTLGPWLGLDPTYAIAKPMKNRPLSRATQESRERRGIRLLPRRGAMADAPRILAAGGSLGMLLDQRARVKPVYAPFFGALARCDRSAGVLMRRLRCPVIFVFCTYASATALSFRVEFSTVLWPDELAGAGPEEIARRVNAVFERAILEHPDQYFWLHDRYRDVPEDLARGTEPAG
jgi:KDO2-lipid IV(A) lauroyltransferase